MMEEERPVLEPLHFHLDSSDRVTGQQDGDQQKTFLTTDCVTCLFCDKAYNIASEKDDVLKHLLMSHKFVIADVPLIADFKGYLNYWRPKFKGKPSVEYCSVIQTNSSPTDPEPSELYYLLSDVLPEDKALRTRLQQEQLQQERDDPNFSRSCLFCKEHFDTNRSDLFDHMVHEHNFNVGHADNLVYTNELLDILENKLKVLQCLFCEKTFKDRHVLKEHMRKKQHKKINPANTRYDKFYIINYLELGKNWQVLQAETDQFDTTVDTGDDSDAASLVDEWSGWTEDRGATVICLFCDVTSTTVDNILSHMKDQHKFDLKQIKQDQDLTFYQQVKLINYIRRQVHQNVCPVCREQSDCRDSLIEHLSSPGHVCLVPESTVWDQPQYFFPTYENDALLCELEEIELDSGEDPKTAPPGGDSIVIAEDCPVMDSILKESGLREQLL